MELSLGEWLGRHKAAEYEETLRAEGCESVEDLIHSELTEQHLAELGLKMFAKIRVWGAIQKLRRAKRPQQMTKPPAPVDATGPACELPSRLQSKLPLFNRPDPSARTLTWSQASQLDSQVENDSVHSDLLQIRPRSPGVDADTDERPAKVHRHGVNEFAGAATTNEEIPDFCGSDRRSTSTVELDSVDFRLARLKSLYEQQLLTREVYEAKQKEVLNEMMPPPLPSPWQTKRPHVEDTGRSMSRWVGDTDDRIAVTHQSASPPSSRGPVQPAPAASTASVEDVAAGGGIASPAAADALGRSSDRWSRSRFKVTRSEESGPLSSQSPPRRSLDDNHNSQTQGLPPRVTSVDTSTTQKQTVDADSRGDTPPGPQRDRWSRSRRRVHSVQTTTSSLVVDVGRESSDSTDEASASPILDSQEKSVAAKRAELVRDSVDLTDTSVNSGASLTCDVADAQPQESDANDNWWESSSGSDTEDLREDEEESCSLRALHAPATMQPPGNESTNRPSAGVPIAKSGHDAHVSPSSVRDTLTSIKSESGLPQASASLRINSQSTRTSIVDDRNDVELSTREVASAWQAKRSEHGTGPHVAVISPSTAEDKARTEVQAAAASAAGGRIFTGMSFTFLLDRDGLQLGKGRHLIFSSRVRELGGLVYDNLRTDSTTHIVTGKRHDHRKLMRFLSGMGVDVDAAKLVSVVCCDWITQCLKLKKLVDEADYLSDLSCRLRPYAWKIRQQQYDVGAGALSVLNTLTAGARIAAVLACSPAAVQSNPASEEGIADRVSVKLRENQLRTGDRQKLSDIRPSSRYTKVANLDSYNTTSTEYDGRLGGTKHLSAPSPELGDIDALQFVRVPVTWDTTCLLGTQAAAARHAELVGPIEKLQGLWQLARRWQEQYWEQPIAGRKIEKDFPYPLACFTRGRTDSHLNFEHDSMLGSSATYGQGTQPAVLIVIDPQEYEAYHGHWPHHLFFLLPESNRGIGYARQVFKEFALSGRTVQDQTKLAFPFYYEIDDLMYLFREVVCDDNGVKQFSTESRPNLLRSMLSLQRLPDLQMYGLLGVGRDRGPLSGKSNEFAVNTMSIYKFRLINVDLTRNVHYIPQLKIFEDIAFNYQLLKDGGGTGSYIPTFKSFKFFARAAARSCGGAAAGRRQRLSRRCQPEDLLESGTHLHQLQNEHQQVVQELVQWVRDKQDEDVRRAKRRQDAILAIAANGGTDPSAPSIDTADLSDDENEEENDDRRVNFSDGGFASLSSKLFAHQKSAVRWLIKVEKTPGLQSGILADEMGLGKTITLLALIAGNTPINRGGSRLPTLVVLPLSLLNQWNREIQIHTHGLNTHVYYGDGRTATAAQLTTHEIVLTTYDVLVNDDESSNANHGSQTESQYVSRGSLCSVKWHRVVCDEAAFIKNLDTKRAKAVHQLKKTHVWLATGSPVQNNIKELQTLLRLCNFTGAVVDRDWRSLCRHVMLRRTMSSIAGDIGSAGSGLKMPKLEETTVSLEWITDRESEMYNKLASKAKAVRGAVHHELLSNVMRMRQACNHPSLATIADREDTVEVDDHVGGGASAVNSLALRAGESPVEGDEGTGAMNDKKYECAKLTALMKILNEAQASKEKVLVFSFFKRFLDLIAVALLQRNIAPNRIVRLHGSMPAHARDAEVQRFRSEPAADIFLISTKAGGLGLNLTTASTIVILEPGWNPTDEEQAVRRAYRIGQLRRVRVVRFVMRNTIEQQVVRLQKEKQTLAASVLTSSALHRMIQHSQAAS